MARIPILRQWHLRGPEDTEGLGAALAAACPWEAGGPRLAYLSGELGSGKTTLVAALLHALGIAEPVRSPSYALLELYPLPGGPVAVHLDCYRLQGAHELEALGLRDYFTDRSLLLIEWPERVGGALPDPDLALQLQVQDDGRGCRVVAHSMAGERWLAAVHWPDNSLMN
jgi:tRNA threonylcarbamoyladenosine biosynthesis protein TsaE